MKFYDGGQMAEITRFRIEGKGDDKHELSGHLTSLAERFINLLSQNGEWECTDDAILQAKGTTTVTRKLKKYQGRMVFLFHRHDDA
jgi:hypothetical protein